MLNDRLKVEGQSKCEHNVICIVADTDKAIMAHPKSKKREILNLRKQLEEQREKM
jgi:hypothetical protein